MHRRISVYAYALNAFPGLNDELSARERKRRERETEKSGKGRDVADVATCLRHLIGNHGTLPPLGRVVQSAGVAYLPIFYPPSFRLAVRDETVNLHGASRRPRATGRPAIGASFIDLAKSHARDAIEFPLRKMIKPVY